MAPAIAGTTNDALAMETKPKIMSNSSTNSQVRVGVRVRPITAKEQGMGSTSILDASSQAHSIALSGRRFTYDAVFDASTSQAGLYAQVSPSLLQAFLDGYNGTILAYGQTGSGKTFTMGSEAHTELEIMSSTGLIPRFMNDLFEQLASIDSNDYRLETSFLEVYGEDVHDLMDVSRASLPLRDDSDGGVVCTGLTTKVVTSAPQAVQVLHEGTLNRTTAATLMNLTSSRSHAVFTVTLTRHGVSSKLTFVDLAGSERMKKTGAEGERAREGIEINKGLLALGNVINALADDERLQNGGKKTHVPYRQSKLTRLLQDALGGNSQTLFLACVSAADTNASETLSTLHYANRARNIQNAPTRNVDATVGASQQLQAYVAVLQAELLQMKFGAASASDSPTGKVSDELLKQKDVNEYLDKLQLLAQKQTGAMVSMKQLVPHSLSPSRPRSTSESDRPRSLVDANQSVLENFDPALLDEVNPDEEMAILDQLLDLQQQDQDFDREQKKDLMALKQVEGELVEQEQLLLQLRDSLKVYHNMKAKYESLMVEVRQLELEKAQLAEQLEQASADPTLGCSRAIQKEMEMVERNLARARNETRKHRQMYKKAEQEAQKSKTMERKIAELKQGRAMLIKKQKEAAARHREMTDSKTREILALKRKDRNAERKMTKLESDIQMHKRNLDMRQAYCKKLLEQKKQTETHLMKLLTMRQRDFRERTLRGVTRREEPVDKVSSMDAAFAPKNEEIESITFFIDKTIDEAVAFAALKEDYEERVSEYSEAMRGMVAAVKALGSNNSDAEKQELELSIEQYELKVELAASVLEQIRTRLARYETAKDVDDRFEAAKRLLQGKSAPVLRTLLMGAMDKLADVELRYRKSAKAVQTKERVVQSFEMEVDSLNNQVVMLKNEMARCHASRNSLGTTDSVSEIRAANVTLSNQLEESAQEVALLKLFASDLAKECDSSNLDLAEMKERLVLVAASNTHVDGVQPPADVLRSIQAVWKELGLPLSERTKLLSQIENCLEDTCARMLHEATQRKLSVLNEISSLSQDLSRMCSSLDVEVSTGYDSNDGTLLHRLDSLRNRSSQVKPTFSVAVARRDALATKVSELCYALGLSKEVLDADLTALLNDFTNAGNNTTIVKLNDDFLTRCEASISKLRLNKSLTLSDNSRVQKEAFDLIAEMNVSEGEVKDLVIQSICSKMSSLPSWWNADTADSVARSVATDGGVVRSTRLFSLHLSAFHDAVASMSRTRLQLSNKLRGLIERTQKTLLNTVDGEFEANEAYTHFHETLFRLPAASKERINACMAEIDVLLIGVEAMSQSEIEALTVVWEALNIAMANRGKFWGGIDESTRELESNPIGPFDDLLQSSAVDAESWVIEAANQSSKAFKELETRLFRLEAIHGEVEQLRTRQDSKSKIISLDSEVRILSAKLNEFEDKKCNKQRLTTKKNTSSTLLQEERFRKQMQAKFTAKLDQLATLLKDWGSSEATAFDENVLSEDVRALLKNSNRSEFMHLRTVEYKGNSKRSASSLRSGDGNVSPPRKRQALPTRPPPKEPSTTRESRLGLSHSSRPTNPARSSKHALSPVRNEVDVSHRAKKSNTTRSPLAQPQPSFKLKRPEEKKRLTLDPFGSVLEQAFSPRVFNDKENPSSLD